MLLLQNYVFLISLHFFLVTALRLIIKRINLILPQKELSELHSLATNFTTPMIWSVFNPSYNDCSSTVL
jgi:hypothetical protein